MPIDHLYGEDVLIACKLFYNSRKISFENKAGYCWLIHPGELSTDSNSDRYISKSSLKAIQEEIATLAIDGENVEPLKNEYRHCLHLRAQQSLELGDFYDYENTVFKLNIFNQSNQKQLTK